MASAVFILDLKGKVLISRNYRGDVNLAAVDRFMPILQELEEDGQTPTPVLSDKGVHYLYIRHNNVYLLALTRKNSNATSILLYLHKLAQVYTEYFKTLEEESIRDNFVLTYELLDEMMDFGFPQITETKILKEYITQEGFKLERTPVRPPNAVTNAVSWRSEGIRYRKNEVFLDVIESVNLMVSATGNVLRSEILGAVKMKCYLSGMPELRLGLNDKVLFESSGRATGKGKAIEMEDVKFHQCVKPLIWCEAMVEMHNNSRIEYMIKAKAQFKRRSTANNVQISIPVPDDADSPKFKTSIGTVTYVPEKSCCIWKIKQFQGAREFYMRAHFGLPSVRDEEPEIKRPPINVQFEIPYFTVSGIQVRYLKVVEKSGYQALPWVRYITRNGDYQLRMPDSNTSTSGGGSSVRMAPI
ncbi:AP-1 complex subunit MU-1-like protein [Syncephalis pseudoplumigaleata]|uniref:AP-1 complex subunit MU-1-like protein n=1 Tax=Syncephalis pseudoplumigaleata TaxID=1712513 RepID=A0A4P9Z503_9FUNG|nr:AP-1 complex subunit MU-1-like protein [Syncephalis pseudoplumigaleata]|eukprot:RKP26670.1 AP-1 complex subunit MU-1-like protein [Syncephalis pseudoplumigaleata]